VYLKIHKQKGIFQLSYFDSEHKDDHWEIQKSRANLAKVEDDPSAAIPLAPPAVTNLEPRSESKYDD
jgi:hypothetical protein